MSIEFILWVFIQLNFVALASVHGNMGLTRCASQPLIMLFGGKLVPIGPPKGIEVRDFILKYRFLSIFWILANFIIILYGNLVGIRRDWENIGTPIILIQF